MDSKNTLLVFASIVFAAALIIVVFLWQSNQITTLIHTEDQLASVSFADDAIYSDLQISPTKKGVALTGFICVDEDLLDGRAVDLTLQGRAKQQRINESNMYELSAHDLAYYKFLGQNCDNHRVFIVSRTMPVDINDMPSSRQVRMYIPDQRKTVYLDATKNDNDQKFGIQYNVNHCAYSDTSENVAPNEPIFDTTKILNEGTDGEWGPIFWKHWVAEPIDGYYCLSQNKELVKKHAFLLAAMGIDYIAVDMTNSPRAYEDEVMTDQFKTETHRPLMAIIDVWGELNLTGSYVPKVVPWAGVTNIERDTPIEYENSSARYLESVYYPRQKKFGLGLLIDDKPTVAIKVASGDYKAEIVKTALDSFGLEDAFTLKPLWAFREQYEQAHIEAGLDPHNLWSSLERCQLDEGGEIERGCNQATGPDQIGVAAAYQSSGQHMSQSDTTARRKGRTLYQQFLEVFRDDQEADFVFLNTWNPWVNPRGCTAGNAYYGVVTNPIYKDPGFNDYVAFTKRVCPRAVAGDPESPREEFYEDGRPAFLDNYTLEYSRIIEPDREFGDCYYQLARKMIFAHQEDAAGLNSAAKSEFGVCEFDLIK